MANHDISNPQFNSALRKYQTSDKAHASIFNDNEYILINNDMCLKNDINNLNKSFEDNVNNILNAHVNNEDMHVKLSDKQLWNNKASTDVATASSNGLMSAGDKQTIDNIVNTISNAVTNTSILSKLKEVDGSGSGLDADLLDGLDSSSFSRSDHNHDVNYLKLSGGTVTGDLNINSALKHNGTTIIDVNGVYRARWNDYAELFEKENVSENIEAGDIVTWCNTGVVKSSKYQDKRVVGVYSNSYGMLLGGEKESGQDEIIEHDELIETGKFIPIGLAGRVSVKVIGDIDIGDLITSSDIEGIGCKCDKYCPGSVIGKSLEKHKGHDIGIVKMLIQNI